MNQNNPDGDSLTADITDALLGNSENEDKDDDDTGATPCHLQASPRIHELSDTTLADLTT